MIRILEGDCAEVMKTLPDCSVDAIVTDPPYGLGFMGQAWDHGVPAGAVWLEAMRVLKPGGYLLAFAGTRTQHRMCCNIEDAGFEIRDMIAWIYGSGFPKSRNGEWGGTALKPALEPITVARKPLAGTVEANWRKHGTGALNIDVCRIPTDGGDYLRVDANAPARVDTVAGFNVVRRGGGDINGRWPANLIHDGSDEVLAEFPAAPGQIADASSSSSRKMQNVYGAMRRGRGDEASAHSENDGVVGFNMRPGARRLDSGSAARFFYCAKADRADRNEGLVDPGPQFKKGSTMRDAENVGRARNGNFHPTVKPTDLMRYLCRLVTPPGGLVLDPFMGSGSTLKAAELEGFSAIGIELDPQYIEIARRRIAADAPLFAEVS